MPQCPICGTPLDAHEPSPCLREWAASIFGWPDHEWPYRLNAAHLLDAAYFAEQCISCGETIRQAYAIADEDEEQPPTRCHGWQPDTRIVDAWLLIEVEPHQFWELLISPRDVMVMCGNAIDPPKSYAPTAPLAILRAAMRARLG